MAEKNTNENQNSKKKQKWIGILLIALLLLFIGLAGYYLERDLEPVPENNVEDSQVMDENLPPESEGGEALDSIEADGSQEETLSDKDLEESQISEIEDSAVKEEAEDKSEAAVESEESSSELEVEDSELESELDGEAESEKLIEEETPAEKESVVPSSEAESTEADQRREEESDTAEISESEETKEAVEDADLSDEEVPEKEEDLSQEDEDSSLLDSILSVLGLSESDFTENLNILFVGLDDEESVALGSIEADSIMLARLRPEENNMELKHIDEDTVYKDQLLRDYHNGDIELAVEEITDSKIDYYVYVHYQGFEKVIDELGGVKINLKEEVKVPGLGLNLKAGDNLLSGKEALNFVRWSDSDNLARFERQQILINSVIEKLKGNNILFNVKELYSTIVESYNSIETDINPVLAAEIFNYIRENDELEIEFIE